LPPDLANQLKQARAQLWALPEPVRELGLHLIAAHHGYARPVIAAVDPGVPPSASAALTQEVALRAARLQRHWGVWALPWWDSLLRAADWAASGEPGEKDSADAATAMPAEAMEPSLG
jgi:CRISPR-associated endonuclease/helicase Cas3